MEIEAAECVDPGRAHADTLNAPEITDEVSACIEYTENTFAVSMKRKGQAGWFSGRPEQRKQGFIIRAWKGP